ncbi:flagellar transcriptional activator FlhD [Pseudomonas nitritireducens]|uniref:Flagellar transcriptional activator FlhD n=1 Tax=Pseudomonas nitroreducens TaxID=46680 RepID=A0A7W7KM76_PSENT|nr:flagellar transcriptional regulator FlhD [Pseudomonas nitritireducens]MBB4865405.1 flagellar transcriptional activator FlhD [Pseudomonas nitritireducens]
MANSDLNAEIQELNLTYLWLAQKALKEDRAAAGVMLGLPNSVLDVIEGMTTAQCIELASNASFLMRSAFTSGTQLSRILNQPRDHGNTRLHAAIALASEAGAGLTGKTGKGSE